MNNPIPEEQANSNQSRKDFLIGGFLSLLGLIIGQLLGEANNKVLVDQEIEKKTPKYSMLIDLEKCVGCNACTIACKRANNTPPSVNYNVVLKKEIGQYPNVKELFLPRPCMQCEKPPCVKVCPVAATKKMENGIVIIDYEKCIGCRYCLTACPYGARSFDFGDSFYQGHKVESRPYFEYQKLWSRKPGVSPINNVRKCHYCIDRVQQGKLPNCVETCVGKARLFGDVNNPNDPLSKSLISKNHWRLKEHLGTKPLTHYLGKWDGESHE